MTRFLFLVILLLVFATSCYAGTWRATYYADSLTGGSFYCEQYGTYDPSDPTTVAVRNPVCGQRLLVCGEECIVVVVVDKCGGCEEEHVDLSRAGWEAVGSVDYVEVWKGELK